MSPGDALAELLARHGAQGGAPAFFTDDELSGWPGEAVAAMKRHKLLAKASPARSAICPGCERACAMPAQVLPDPSHAAFAFIDCDKRDDIGRVAVALDRLERWQASGGALATCLSRQLGLTGSGSAPGDPKRWTLGVLRGTKHSSQVVLAIDQKLTIQLAGYKVALDQLLAFDDLHLTIDKLKLTRLADAPAAGGGERESAKDRRQRLANRAEELKAQGVPAFLKTIAGEEGISASRLKQLLAAKPALSDSDSRKRERHT